MLAFATSLKKVRECRSPAQSYARTMHCRLNPGFLTADVRVFSRIQTRALEGGRDPIRSGQAVVYPQTDPRTAILTTDS